MESQSNFYFDIYASSKSDVVDRVVISSYDKLNGRKVVADYNPGVRTYDGTYDLVAPFTTDTLTVSYTFDVRDSGGNTAKYVLEITVIPSEAKELRELTSLILTYGDVTKPDAFDFNTLQPVKSGDEPEADIVLDEDVSGFCWTTLSDIMFVRQNSFDYSSATDVSLIGAYNNSLRSVSVNDLRPEDVILVGRVVKDSETGSTSVEALGVAKIQIVDTANGKLWFNLKVL